MSNTNLIVSCERTINTVLSRIPKLECKNKDALENG